MEIAKSIGAVNDTAQSNAAGSIKLSDNAQELLKLARDLEAEITHT